MSLDFVADFFVTLVQFVSGLETWQQVLALVAIGAIPFIESYLGSFLGVLVGIDPFIAVPAAVVGNIISTFLVIAVASRVRTAATKGRGADAEMDLSDAPKSRQKIGTYLNRFGVPGVCLLGPLVIASQITAPTLIALGATKRGVYVWSAISILAWGILFGFFSHLVVTWAIG